MNIWQELKNSKKPFTVLAPMEAVTDIVFREVIMTAGRPDLFFTEFVNVDSFCSEKGEFSTRGRLAMSDMERPIIVQIWGNKPENFETMAKKLSENYHFNGIDINMGCPDKSVVKQGSGSGLIGNYELAGEIIMATKRGAGDLPVSIKTRLGQAKIEEYRDWLKFLLEQDIANLTIHLRTRKEMSKVAAHYELIDEILKLRDELAPQTTLTINGDIADKISGEKLAAEHPGIDGIMIGRGVFENPFCFNGKSHKYDRTEYLKLLKLQLDLHDKYSHLELRKFDPLKRFFKIYLRNFSGAKALREQLMHCKNTNEVRDIIKTYE